MHILRIVHQVTIYIFDRACGSPISDCGSQSSGLGSVILSAWVMQARIASDSGPM